jgi:hypothetical protein
MNEHSEHRAASDGDRPLAVYLRDHFAGSTAGLALVRRCRRENTGTPLATMLADIEAQLDDDRRSLEAMMSRLGIRPSGLKSAIGSLSETVGRLKGNGRLIGPSPSSPVVELEGLAAGILTKRNLWRSLQAAAPTRGGLDTAELDNLIERATSQLERVLAAHEGAAREAFGSPAQSATISAPDS